MYSKIGAKIKTLAVVCCIIESILAAIAGIVLSSYGNLGLGTLVLILGPTVAYLFSLLLYGFGELIDKVCNIEKSTRGGEIKSKEQSKVDDQEKI